MFAFAGCEDSSSSSSSSTGDIMFWVQSDFGCGKISVSIPNKGTKTISSYFSSGVPDCGSSGAANFADLKPGTYKYTASCNSKTWNGSATVKKGVCLQIQLLSTGGSSSGSGSGGSGSGGGGTGGGCDWSRAVNVLVPTGKWGTRCNDPKSFEVGFKNTSSKKVKIFVCVQGTDGKWSSWGDVSGTEPGKTWSGGYNCPSNGKYKVFAEYYDTYVANGYCGYGGCQ